MPASPYSGRGPDHLALWQEHLVSPSFVYVIQGEREPPIKVGFAHDVTARIASLQTGNPDPLRLLHVVPGDPLLEWFFHERLKGDRVRGEWFDGPTVPPFMEYVSGLVERMIAAYDGSGAAPFYADLDPVRFTYREDPRKNPIKVTFVEPNPKVPREVAEEMRRSVWGCSRDVYLGPPDSIVRQQTPGRAKNGGYLGS